MQRLHNTHKKRKYKTKSTESLAIRLEICQPPDTIYVNSKLLWNSKRQTAAVHFFFCVSIVRSSVCLWVLQIKTILSLLSNYLPFVCYRYHHHHHCWWHWIALAFHLFQSRSRYLSIVVSVVLIWCTRFSIFFCSCIQHTVVKIPIVNFF